MSGNDKRSEYDKDTANVTKAKSYFKFSRDFRDTPVYGRAGDIPNAPDLMIQTVDPQSDDAFYKSDFYNKDGYFDGPPVNSIDWHAHMTELDLHQHEFFELIYVLDGEMYQRIENERHVYPQGSLCLLNRHIRHQEEFTNKYRVAFLALPVQLVRELLAQADLYFFGCERDNKHDMLQSFFSDDIDGGIIGAREYIDFIPRSINDETSAANVTRNSSGESAAAENMRNLFLNIENQFKHPTVGSTYLIKGYITQIFHELANRERYSTTPRRLGTDAESRLFDEITGILKKSHGRVSREALSKELHYNSDYLNRIVKQYTGMRLMQYGRTFTMKEAARLLDMTDMRIGDICEQLEISNQTQFYKQFQDAYGLTPRDYRNRFTEDKKRFRSRD